MFQDRSLDRVIGKQIIEKNAEDRLAHVSSGKLSASMLGYPVQWQVLKMIGIQQPELDEYVLRKFKRGNDVEDWLTSVMPGLVEKQKGIEYRNCVGYVDAMVDTSGYDLECGIIPHEIKSVSNAKYKRIVSAKQPDNGHLLQACLYALATGSKHFAIDYVATDDLRIETFVMETSSVAHKVEEAIDAYEKAMKEKKIPDFVEKEKWNSMPNYCSYPDWVNLSSELAMMKLEKEFPDEYNKLIKG